MPARDGLPDRERFLRSYIQGPESQCWPWIGRIKPNGYPWLVAELPNGTRGKVYAHRFAYETLVGPIPPGHEIDHVCRNRACVNPAHLEAVTVAENRRRRVLAKTHCVHGHEFTDDNTYFLVDRDGYTCRFCRICSRNRAAALRARAQ